MHPFKTFICCVIALSLTFINIIGFECLESTAYYGIATNMVVYLGTILNGSNASNAANVAIWGGTCYFTPLIGAVLTDNFLGNYKTILISLLIYLLVCQC